ncbi:BON domain-containing protein [Massilia sp. YIM B02769]|jgi:osmotically-inducible protein OsmY|uniref:BON domain-containing protein n=1 Tax=unclassified Massilia TaxID=2609279 RepID=UPI0025B6D213|nr:MULTISPECIES: BON domain-containing protein [unclassified Massilia]MDN4056804.1 BON domain-containing protein [Massilia sp. YIM B02769]
MSKTGQALKGSLTKVMLGAALLGALQGCVPLVMGGAALGAAATMDRRTLGAQTEDKSITVKAEVQIPKIVGDAGHVNIASFNRKVLLTGEVRDEAMKAKVEAEVRRIENVVSVINELAIAGPSSYTSRSSDALITTNVKASLVEMKTISATSFKVVTERGTVYLMGRVTQREGDLGAKIAQSVSGVQRVVKIFEYITEEELRTQYPQSSTVAL